MPSDSRAARRAYWLKTLHQWHWISAAASLVGMLGFAITGITLNHAGRIGAEPVVTTLEATVPAERLAGGPEAAEAPLPPALRDWIATELDVRVGARAAEWSASEIYLSLPRPGGDAWLSIDRQSGELVYERTDRGWVSYFNDLHKGRHTGAAWGWFLDVFAVACVVFTLTGLFLLWMHARHRPATWPMVGLGLLLPALLALIFIH
ncbi:MAG TPA: PepSY-associated TM helix domain-containing protein [Arenimonas sp.]|nr:PepSY-associated TM helix domain-containing protein [Arenimonas sp.]